MAYKTVIGRENIDVEIKGIYTEITRMITERHIHFNVEELPVGTKVSLVHRGELVTGEVISIDSDRIIIHIESMKMTYDAGVHNAICAELEKIK